MSDIDMDGALDALTAELPDEVAEPVVSDESMVGDNPDVESFTGFDPTILPEDMQQVYKSMQADYTRKTQEIAELRRNYESFSEAGVDPDIALQAVGFLDALNNDPSFAQQVAMQIQQTLGTPDVSQTMNEFTPDNYNDTSYDGLPPQLQAELSEMRAFREEMVAMQAQQEIIGELEAMEDTIRTLNPSYSDDDFEAIYSLAYATDGDLMAAADTYHSIQQRLLGNYLEAKTVPHGATPAPASPSSVPSRSFSNVDDAHKAALEAVRNMS